MSSVSSQVRVSGNGCASFPGTRDSPWFRSSSGCFSSSDLFPSSFFRFFTVTGFIGAMLKVIYYNMTDFMGPVELLVFSILHRIPASFTLKILVGLQEITNLKGWWHTSGGSLTYLVSAGSVTYMRWLASKGERPLLQTVELQQPSDPPRRLAAVQLQCCSAM